MSKWLWTILTVCCLVGPLFAQGSNLSEEDIQCILDRLEKKYQWLAEDKHLTTSTVDIQFYGYIKLDAAYDTNRVTDGNSAYWVESSATAAHHDNQFNMTARQTRLGLKFFGPDFGEATTYAQFEGDFYGGGAENKNTIMMRHAFMKLEWPEDKFHILAGQYWDVIAPLVPTTLNYHVQWIAGDIGYRRPQIRFHKGIGPVGLTAAFTRSIGHANTAANPGPGDTGEDSGMPGYQARFAYTFDVGEQKATFGVSGHYAQEEYDFNTVNTHKRVPSWSGNLDLALPLGKVVKLQGEYYIGKNMDAYLGGILQGVAVDNTNRRITPIKARGGWGGMTIQPTDSNWSFNVGASADHVSDSDADTLVALTGNDARSKNFSVYGNAIYKINSAASWGLEISRWRTAYRVADAGDAVRIQTSFIFKF